MECGYGCSHVRDEIMVKAWGVCLVRTVYAMVSPHGGLLWATVYYPTVAWVSCRPSWKLDWLHLPGQADWEERQKSGCPVAGGGDDSPIARVPSAGPLGAKRTAPPYNGSQLTRGGCSLAPAALNAPAKEARHRVTVCPSARVPVRPAHLLQSQPSPSYPILPGPPEREAGRLESGDWSQGQGGIQRCRR